MKLKTAFVFLAFVFTLNTVAQKQTKKPAKTIYEVLNLTPGGCAVNKAKFDNSQYDIVSVNDGGEDGPFNNESFYRPHLDSLMETSHKNFTRDSQHIAKFETFSKARYQFANGNYLFIENGLFGLRDLAGKVLIPAKFHSVNRDGKHGLVAYENQYCNYYNTEGQKLLKSDYYSIERTPKNTFIVQTQTGYGVLQANQIYLVSPKLKSIHYETNENLLCYQLQNIDDQVFYLSENGKDTFPFDYMKIIDAEHLTVNNDKLFNIKTKKFLICEDGFVVNILNPKYKVATLTKKWSDEYVYLIDFNGNLISNQKFAGISQSDNNNKYLYASVKDTSKNSQYGYSQGIIDLKGNWVISPKYTSIGFLNDSILRVGNSDGKMGVMNFNTKKMMGTFKYQEIHFISPDNILGVIKSYNKDVIESEVISLKDQKIIKSQLGYARIDPTVICNETRYIAAGVNGECLLNQKFEQISPKSYTRIFYDRYRKIYYTYMSSNEFQKARKQLLDCDGKIITLNIEGENFDNFENYKEVSASLSHVLIEEGGSGYFMTTEGKFVPNNTFCLYISPAFAKDFYIGYTVEHRTLGHYCIFNSEGETVLSPYFDYINKFDTLTGLALYNYDGKQKGFLTKDGELLFGTKYAETSYLGIYDWSNHYFRVMKNGRWGVVGINDNIIVPLKYKSINLEGGIIYAYTHTGIIDRYDLMGNKIHSY